MHFKHWRVSGLAACCVVLAACKKEAPPSYPPAPLTINPAAVATAAGPGPPPAPVPGAAALGLPCTSEHDLQCAFSRCIGNRCGGCRSSAECKPGAQCLPSWVGYACFGGGSESQPQAPAAAPTVSSPADASTLEALRARCVQRSNELRAQASRGPLNRRRDQESCADAEAQTDGARGTAHGAFGRCQEGAQNECPGWPGPIERTLDQCLAQMFAEGPGPFADHGHYLNMTDPKFSGVACGFSTGADGQVWLVQNFFR